MTHTLGARRAAAAIYLSQGAAAYVISKETHDGEMLDLIEKVAFDIGNIPDGSGKLSMFNVDIHGKSTPAADMIRRDILKDMNALIGKVRSGQ